MTTQSYVYSTLPTVSVEWITDDKSLTNSNNISTNLQIYFARIARGKIIMALDFYTLQVSTCLRSHLMVSDIAAKDIILLT